MSLNFSLEKTEWSKQEQAAKDMSWPMVEAMIHLMMVIGMTRITPKNLAEVILRLRYAETLCGRFFHTSEGSKEIPTDLIASLVGMSTNVSPETWLHFTKRITASWERDHHRHIQGEVATLASRKEDA